MNRSQITAELRQTAQQLGFARLGVCPAVAPPGIERFDQWLAEGYAGEMHYLPDRAAAYRHPEHVQQGARSIVMLAMNYRTDEPAQPAPGQGRIARYAWGEADYHDLIRQRLRTLADRLRELSPDCHVRSAVDTAPLMERQFAQLAGLGWIGKNTLLLDKRLGSWFFLAALLTDVELEYDAPHAADHCGTCRACLDACPTDAFVDAYVLDARKCIAYTTIEQRRLPDEPLRQGQGDWLFGCDVCQDVCPWNHKAPRTEEPAFHPTAGSNPIALVELLQLDAAEFKRRYRDTPISRPGRVGVLSSAAIVLGNQRHAPAVPLLAKLLASDDDPRLRAACAWSLGQIGTEEACRALANRLADESDATVCAEINSAIPGGK
jgi:epoxyqueuosine reductase